MKVKPLKRKILLEKITKITPWKIKKRKITPSAVHPDPHYSGSSSQWNTHYNKRNTMTSGRAAQNKRRNSTSKLTVIDGDSILKHLQGHNFSRPHSKVHVFLAASLTVMADHIRPLVRRKPDSLIIHIGTNILQHVNSLHECADEIVDLTWKVEQEGISVIISSLATQADDYDLSRGATEVNKTLRKFCWQNNWGFINNDNIIAEKHLNRSCLHLKRAGTSLLSQNWSTYIIRY